MTQDHTRHTLPERGGDGLYLKERHPCGVVEVTIASDGHLLIYICRDNGCARGKLIRARERHGSMRMISGAHRRGDAEASAIALDDENDRAFTPHVVGHRLVLSMPI